MQILRNNELIDMTSEEQAAFLAERAAASTVTAAMVKGEARRRILARYPDWQQANMTARGVELMKLRVLNGTWTTAEQDEVTALDAAWTWIKAVRAASDQIENTAPIAASFRRDARWPA